MLAVVERISQIFWGPSLEQCRNMVQTPFWLPIEKDLSRLDSSSAAVVKEIKATLSNFSSAQALFDGLEEEYVRLFISDRAGIRSPLYASCYADRDSDERAPLMGAPALAMQDRFRSKGVSLADDIREPPDHLSIELEYLYFLLRQGWADDDPQLVDEASSFASDIMLPWILKLQHTLAEVETAGRFYPLITTLLCQILILTGGLNRRP